MRGPRPRPLRARPYLGYSVGVDVERLAVRAAVVDFGNAVQQTVKRDLSETAGFDAIAEAIVDVVGDVLAVSHVAPERLVGVGVGLPRSVMSPEAEADTSAQVFEAAGREEIATRLRRAHKSDVVFEHNARCFALAEQRVGRLAGCHAGAVVIARYGVAVGFVQDGVALVGEGAPAGELGHTIIRDGGEPCVCGRRGCLEAYAGARPLLKRWKGPGSSGAESGEHSQDGSLRELVAARLETDEGLREIIHDGACALGLAIGNLTNIFGPMVTVVHGLYPSFGEEVRALIEQSAIEQTRGRLLGPAKVRFSALGEFAGGVGAALLARDTGFAEYVAAKVLRRGAATG